MRGGYFGCGRGRIPSDNITHREEHAEQNHDDEEHAQKLAISQDQFKFAVFVLGHE
jgi:hypothetical protein